MSKVKFSIVIPVYNAENYLQECLNSIISQSYNNYEVILINDGSTDHSLEIIKKNLHNPRVRLIDSTNFGVSYARNIGLTSASGDYIFMIDSDDLLKQNSLKKIAEVIDKTNADIVSFKYEKFYRNYFSENIKDSPSLFCDTNKLDFFYQTFDKSKKHQYQGAYVWSKIFKRHLLDNLRFDPKLTYYEDEEFLARLYSVLLNEKIVTVKESFYLYRQRSSSLIHSNRLTRLFVAYRVQRRIMKLFSVTSIEYKLFDQQRLLSLLKLIQLRLSSDNKSGYKEFKKILWNRRHTISFKLLIPYMLGCQIATMYSKFRLRNVRPSKKLNLFWD